MWLPLIAFTLLGIPSIILGAPILWGVHLVDLPPILALLVFGVGIVAGAFLISWAAEVAQLDVSGSLAIAVLALIAILPEYVIEFTLAREAGLSYDVANPCGDRIRIPCPEEIGRVAANVTGANRLLIGLGWAAVILIYWLKRRRVMDMRGEMGLEITMLTIATLATLLIFFMREVHFVLAAALIALYIIYLWISSRKEVEEPDLIGPAALLGSFDVGWRRAAVLFLFFYSAIVIIAAAHPFVEDGLIATGLEYGIDEFILIQWLAPLASESPEIIVAVLFSLRANPVAGMTALISAEVNQLTLLIGSMGMVFSGYAGAVLDFPLDWKQSVEFLLTTTVSLLALLLVAKRAINWWAGAILLGLFIAHLPFTDPSMRIWFVFIYLALSAAMVLLDWRRLKYLVREEPMDLATASKLFRNPFGG